LTHGIVLPFHQRGRLASLLKVGWKVDIQFAWVAISRILNTDLSHTTAYPPSEADVLLQSFPARHFELLRREK
jgi:hypothetical protein